jgi:hypothetical protein
MGNRSQESYPRDVLRLLRLAAARYGKEHGPDCEDGVSRLSHIHPTFNPVAGHPGHRLYAVRDWVGQAEVDAGRGHPGALTTEEREELARLRREVRTSRMERDILKKATAFFAKENV